MRKRVVITGCGLVTPLGMNLEKVWQRLCRGDSGVRALTEGPLSLFRSKVAGLCDDFSFDGYFTVKDANRIDRFTQFALTSAIDAVNQAGLDFDREDRSRCGSIIGCGVGGLGEIERQQDRMRHIGLNKVSPFTIPKIMPNAAACQVSIHYQLHGPSYAVSTACASANNAMADAFERIGRGEMDIIVTGGTETAVTELGMAGFCAMHALTESADDPTTVSRPFDKNRGGFVIAEGAGIVVFEELEHAKKRGAVILGEVLGTGITTDASHITQPDSEGVNASEAIKKSLQSASLNPEDIDYVNLHGTGTKLGDIAETNAVKRAFGDLAKKIPLSSSKSQIGHLLGGSGGVEIIFSLLALRDGIIPPTINLTEPDPECDLDYTPLVAREHKISRVLSNSFGFGGHNACLIIGSYRD